MSGLKDALTRVEDDSSGFALLCVQALVNAADDNDQQDFGFVTQNGTPMPNFDPVKTWGINYSACMAFCGRDQIPWPDFQLASFANSFTNWLLPWLTLVAQLPYQTESSWGDLMSLFLSIGSPALVTYSLCVSMLNRYFLRQRFKSLKELASDEAVDKRWPGVKQHLNNVLTFLQEAQQVPIRVSQRGGWLSSLLVCSENHKWWKQVSEYLVRSKRTLTYSFWAQTLAATIAWAFTIAGAIAAALGNEETALQLSASTIWVWMLPIVAGWILVGTQSRSHSVDAALRTTGTRRALEQADLGPSPVYTEKAPQAGIVVRSGLAAQLRPQREQTSGTLSGIDRTHTPTWHDISIVGDEEQRGPIYNYARVFTWNQVARTITLGLRKTIKNVQDGNPCHMGTTQKIHHAQLQLEDSELLEELVPPARAQAARGSFSYGESTSLNEPQESIHMTAVAKARGAARRTPAKTGKDTVQRWNQVVELKYNLGGDAWHTANYCGLQPHEPRDDGKYSGPKPELLAYTSWANMPLPIRNTILVAAFFAILVQWGSAGSAILIAYNTPTIGLGCRSGSYTIYALAGTLVWLLLTASSFLSHAAMLKIQAHELADDDESYNDRRLRSASNQSASSVAITDESDGGEENQTLQQGHRQQIRSFLAPLKSRSRSRSSASSIRERPVEAYVPSFLAGLSIATRFAGKLLAVLNGTFLVLISFFEIIGIYDNCWCESVYVWNKAAGWVTIFKTNHDLVTSQQGYWVGGIAMSALSCLITFGFLAIGTRETSNDAEDD